MRRILNSITFSLFLLQFVSLNSLAWPCFDTWMTSRCTTLHFKIRGGLQLMCVWMLTLGQTLYCLWTGVVFVSLQYIYVVPKKAWNWYCRLRRMTLHSKVQLLHVCICPLVTFDYDFWCSWGLRDYQAGNEDSKVLHDSIITTCVKVVYVHRAYVFMRRVCELLCFKMWLFSFL